MAKKKKPLTLARVKKATAGIKAIVKAHKNLDLQIKKHGKHLSAMFEHGL